MSQITVAGSNMGNSLMTILNAADIMPGDTPSYELCKTIYLYHPLGAKIAEKPVKLAQSQKRDISVPDAPGDDVKSAFEAEWDRLRADHYIFSCRTQSRIYGIASLAVLTDGVEPNQALDYNKISDVKISFNVYDPLNTAGSLIFNQDPLAGDFQHAQEIAVNGKSFHKSRARVIINEFPIYLSYTASAFGFSGRSVYQRSLYPLKSYIQTMRTNDMISRKAGVIVAKIKQMGATVTNAMLAMVGVKRNVVKEAEIDNVISIGTEGDAIESMNLQNLEGPFKLARENIIQDIASGTPMPAKMLTEESFAQGFADGTEDAKAIARYIEEERATMQPLYEFMDKIVMHRAWNKDFFALMQKKHPEVYGNMTYEAAFYQWSKSFKAQWPSLLIEPESEQVRVADVKLRALVAVLQVLMPELPRDQLARVIEWVADNMNEMKIMFGSPLELDYTAIEDYDPKEAMGDMGEGGGGGAFGSDDENEDDDEDETPADKAEKKQRDKEGEAPGNFRMKAADSADKAIAALKEAAQRLTDEREERRRRVAKAA